MATAPKPGWLQRAVSLFAGAILGAILRLLLFLRRLFTASLRFANRFLDWCEDHKRLVSVVSFIFTLIFGSVSFLGNVTLFGDGITIIEKARPAATASPASASTIEFEFLGISNPQIDCADRDSGRLHEVGPFLSEHHDVLDSSGDVEDAVVRELGAFKDKLTPRHRVFGFILIGSADEHPLGPRGLALYRTNDGLAKRRAEFVREKIGKVWRADVVPSIIAVLREAKLIGAGHNAIELRPDRTVRICAVWGT